MADNRVMKVTGKMGVGNDLKTMIEEEINFEICIATVSCYLLS